MATAKNEEAKPASADTPQKKGRKGCLIVVVFFLAIIGSFAYLWFGPSSKIVLGPDTTVLTSPLNPDGTVNYVEALDAKYRAGVTPENNAAVLLLQALGPEAIPPEVRSRTYDLLGIAPLPATGDYLVDFSLPPPTVAERESGSKIPTAYDILGDVTKGPWSRDKYPAVAEWLARNENPLALVRGVVRRERFYMPLVSPSDPPRMVDLVLLHIGKYCELGRALAARAMLAAGEGREQDACQDIVTAWLLASRMAQRPTLIDAMISVSVEATGWSGVVRMVSDGRLSPGQAKALLAALEELPPIRDITETLNTAERYVLLDMIAMVSQQRRGGIVPETELKAAATCLRVDWNHVLRTGNQWYDRIVAASNQPTHVARQTAWQAIDADVKERQGQSLLRKLVNGPTGIMETSLIRIVLPSFGLARAVQDELEMQRDVTKLALALAIFKAEHGSYPDKLEFLSPEYLKAIPNDLFVDKPLIYRRSADGYLLYSVGKNTRDDGGKTRTDGFDYDDVAVRAGAAATTLPE